MDDEADKKTHSQVLIGIRKLTGRKEIQALRSRSTKARKSEFCSFAPTTRRCVWRLTEGNVTRLQKCVKEKFGFSQTSRVGQSERDGEVCPVRIPWGETFREIGPRQKVGEETDLRREGNTTWTEIERERGGGFRRFVLA